MERNYEYYPSDYCFVIPDEFKTKKELKAILKIIDIHLLPKCDKDNGYFGLCSYIKSFLTNNKIKKRYCDLFFSIIEANRPLNGNCNNLYWYEKNDWVNRRQVLVEWKLLIEELIASSISD